MIAEILVRCWNWVKNMQLHGALGVKHKPQTVLMIMIDWISWANARRVLLVATFIAFCYRVVTHQKTKA